MCGIPSRGLFQNGGDGWDKSYGHGICGRTGARNAERAEEAEGPVGFGVGEVAEAPRSSNERGGNCA